LPAEQVPGFRDLLPVEAESLRAIQEAALNEMGRWGYGYVITPILESLDTLARGLTVGQQRQLLKLIDQDGSVLGLVGERTIPVARVASGKLRSSAVPLRLCYSGPVLSLDSSRFFIRHRESYQVGAELIGASGAVADAELIALALRCLEAAGLNRPQVEVGHAGFFQGLLDGLEVDPAVKEGLRQALGSRDLVGIEAILEKTPLRSAEHELLLRFPALRGGREILEAAGALVRTRRSELALQELGAVHDVLQALGLDGAVRLDLGAIRNFDFYTGIIFESYRGDLGRPLAQGGRYDHLLARFGRPAPATGFVLHLDPVVEALRRSNLDCQRRALDAAVAWSTEGMASALRLGARLRESDLRVVVATQALGVSAARAWQSSSGARHLLHTSGDEQVRWLAPGEPLRCVPAANLLAEIGAESERRG
jgi:ATP phosphoribosyltransferase regulatory subunit